MNKVDLVSNKRKFRSLEAELVDLGKWDKIFHTSVDTGFGMDALKEYIVEQARPRPWTYHSNLKSDATEVEKLEELMR